MTETDNYILKEEDSGESLSKWERLSFFILLVVFFAFGLFDHSLWSSNDTREGAMIAEMYRTGT